MNGSDEDRRAGLSRRALLRTGAVGTAALAGCPGGDGEDPTTNTSVSTTAGDPERSTTPGATRSTSAATPPAGTESGTEPGTTTPTAPPPAFASEYGTVVDVANELRGTIDTEPINWVFDQYADDDTLLYFPDGTYVVGSHTFRRLNHFALAPAMGATPTFVPSGPEVEIGPYLLTFMRVSDFRMEGLTFDFRAAGDGGRVQVLADGDFTVRDVETVGKYPDDVTAFRFDVRSDGAAGLVERLVAEQSRQTNESVTGVYVGRHHAGSLTFRDCRLAKFSDNGLYASAPGGAGGEIPEAQDGPVHVEGGVYSNSNIANVRLGSTGSSARDVTIVVDEVPPDGGSSVNARGLRLRAQRDQVIERCHVRLGPEAGDGYGGIVVHPDSGGATVRDTVVEVERDGIPAVNAIHPSGDPGGSTFENVVVTGGASGGTAFSVTGRDGTVLRNCCVRQSGAERDGVRFVDSGNCSIDGSTIDVTAEPTVFVDSDVTVTDVDYDGDCSATDPSV